MRRGKKQRAASVRRPAGNWKWGSENMKSGTKDVRTNEAMEGKERVLATDTGGQVLGRP